MFVRRAVLVVGLVISIVALSAAPASAESRPDLLGVRVMSGADSATGILNSQRRASGSSQVKSSGRGALPVGKPVQSGYVDRLGIGVDPATIPGTQLRELLLQRQRSFYGLNDPSNWLWNNLVPLPGGTPSGGGVPVPRVDPTVLAREAAATLRLPSQTVRIGPDPSRNRWNMMAVGHPVWLWRDGASSTTETVSLAGVTLNMTAKHQSTTYDMGDGARVTCTASTPWVAGAQPPGSPSPDCGHVYSRPGKYTISATHHWQLSWSAMGQSGTLPMSNASSTAVTVGELASVVIER